MVAIFLGAPGSGKGTQAERLKQYGYRSVSTGDIFRSEIASGTELGQKIRKTVESGALVADETLYAVMSKVLSSADAENMLLDGFPRTVAQAKWLDSQLDVSAIIHLDIDEDSLLRRLEGRLSCEKCKAVFHAEFKPPKLRGVCDNCGASLQRRTDDAIEKVRVRLEAFSHEMGPLLAFYANRSQYLRVDASRDVPSVAKAVKEALDSLKS